MGNRSKGYWLFFLLAIVMVTVSFIMLRSPDQHTHEIARYLAYGAIVVLLIARFAFRKPAPPTPPMPRD